MQNFLPRRSYENGARYFQVELPDCFVDFCPGGSQRNILIVSFEAAGNPLKRPDGSRDGFGAKFYTDSGYTMLGIKPKLVDWYRTPHIAEYFCFLRETRFFDGYEKVVFAGISMGGFAALVFSSVNPGSIVVAIQPQSTLAAKLVPWEKRWMHGQIQDWSGPFADGAECARSAASVVVAYDPFLREDAGHVNRLPTANLLRVPLSFLGHNIGGALLGAKHLKNFMRWSIDGQMDREKARVIGKDCRATVQYQAGALAALVRRGKLVVAERFIQKLEAPLHTTPKIWLAAAGYYEAVGETVFLERQWQKSARHSPKNARLWAGYVHYLAKAGRPDEARLRLAEIRKRAADKVFIEAWVAKNAIRLGLY